MSVSGDSFAGYKCVSVKTGKTLSVTNFDHAVQVDYLTEMSSKPRVEVPVLEFTAGQLEIFKQILSGPIPNNTPSSWAVYWMYKTYQGISATLETDWTSYGQLIGRASDLITPLALVSISQRQTEFKGTNPGGDVRESGDLGILAKCLMVYRVCQTPIGQSGYQMEILRRLGQLYAVDPFNLLSTAGVNGLSHWLNDPAYCALIAALDMFIMRFPNHPLSRLRACTLGSLFRDCVIIPSVSHTSKVLGTTPGRVFLYAFSKELAEDIERVAGGDEGVEKFTPNSYFQYARDFGLVRKSAYSASANPNLFVWCHMIGTLAGKRRSMYARMVDCANPVSLLVQAAHVAFYMGASADLQVRFTETVEERNNLIRQTSQLMSSHTDHMHDPDQPGPSSAPAIEVPALVGPSSYTPIQVLEQLMEHEQQIPRFMWDRFLEVMPLIDGSRPQTVGEFVKGYFERRA
ncbi:MAG: nucleocapsid protein [Wufeng shrew rhabdovirus 1]|nr:MAG: nucleocapsid protein [Wufeng shrew rhabdovirus 1]